MSNFNKQKFFNRELSWLQFNKRVFLAALDYNNPLLERISFLSIVSSNLDEFFMVRVAALFDQVNAGFNEKDQSGFTPKEQLEEILKESSEMIKSQYLCYNSKIFNELKTENINILKAEDLSSKELSIIDSFFRDNIYPVLTPIVIDQGRPFPLISNKSINIALLMKDKTHGEEAFGTIQVPTVLKRVIEVDSNERVGKNFILLEDVIKLYIGEIFSGHEIIDLSLYRITRNGDLTLDEEGAEDLLESIEQSLKMRKWGRIIRLEVEQNCNEKIKKLLQDEMELSSPWIFEINGPLDLTFLRSVSSLKGFEHLKYPPLKQSEPIECMDKDLFKAISNSDILVHHPYNSFKPIVDLVRTAASDPDVLAIKQTLYRVSGNSPIVEALAEAAENGKQVTVLMELKARFDEENNIHWAKRLEKSGCQVIYGLVGLKTHCKMLMIVRREDSVINRYVHLGTGNYNDITANFYTDLGIFTKDPVFGEEVAILFNMLSGHTQIKSTRKVYPAPLHLRNKLIELIRREKENALEGKTAAITAKMNSLVDDEIINELYEASQAGVTIKLIVRGVCSLKPKVKDLSDNIEVSSIIGRFLEHSRIFYFHNNGDDELFLSSADWMRRNLSKRVETMFIIDSIFIKEKIKELLNFYLNDNVNRWILNSDGTYIKVINDEIVVNSQEKTL
ncbi:polyphosphate kinase 1 [Clostridium cellulovorans]|uniref:Polyphosphate kinase n=1 Tax=Clostridium cellulovorans (strain ATCC 35296 / DSM 3052 / OCM 3 / 743B) TaxID=573061 RepID=D9SSB0_CLOC7|nr:polyphosphate kinase 1 [Clostridium cellulovorans]ADL52557.1 Polyphosphate kinase [Clostridium cellulovorans 743B]